MQKYSFKNVEIVAMASFIILSLLTFNHSKLLVETKIAPDRVRLGR